ncbi:MAG: VWA domain-containing protein [Isosphaeraceae bacterium]|nr:VWA domain-containing protein [Isosphaeraceae bacterium]
MSLVLACMIAALGQAEASGPAAEPPGAGDGSVVVITQADESKFPEINVYFELRKGDGTPIRDAVQGEFRLTEDGKERPITSFDAPITVQSRPTTVVLVVDRSGSMREGGKMAGMRAAVRTFLDGLPRGSRVAVVAFGSDVDTTCPFTEDLEKVRDAIDAIEPFGGTRFYDAVVAAVELVEEVEGRKAILALTDGQDTESREADLGRAVEVARRANLPVHTLGLGRGGQIDDESLERLAERTRGQFYRAESAEQLRKIYEEIAERLGATYRVAFPTDRPLQDGTLRPIALSHVRSRSTAETKLFIPGMVVPSPGWSGLFTALLVGLSLVLIAGDRLWTRLLRR